MTDSFPHPRVVARSLPEANQDVHRLGPATGVVSIGEPQTEPAYGFQPENPFHLRFEFHDLIDNSRDTILGDDVRPPHRKDVEGLLDRSNILRTTELVYCHCNAGISRSTAFAYILRCDWLGPGHEARALRAVRDDRPRARPNPLIVEFADDLLGRDGQMLAHIDDPRP